MNDNGIYDEIYGKLINIINIIFIAGWGIVTLIEFIIGIFIIQIYDFFVCAKRFFVFLYNTV